MLLSVITEGHNHLFQAMMLSASRVVSYRCQMHNEADGLLRICKSKSQQLLILILLCILGFLTVLLSI